MLGAIAAATYGMNPLFTLPLYQEDGPLLRSFLPLFVFNSHSRHYDCQPRT